MRPRQPQLAKPHCLFEGDRAILIEKVIHIKFSAFQHIQLSADQMARLPFYGVKWPFSRGRGQ